jgi:hypothetical protein
MTIRVVPTRVHAAADYVTGPVLAAAPTIFRLDGERGSALPPRVLGAAATAYSAFTDYELAVRRVIPLRMHLALDAAGGVALAAFPWLTGAARKGVRHWLPHALVGAQEVALALTTKPAPSTPPRWRRYALAVGVPAATAAGGVGVWRMLKRRAAQRSDVAQPVTHEQADTSAPLARETQDATAGASFAS